MELNETHCERIEARKRTGKFWFIRPSVQSEKTPGALPADQVTVPQWDILENYISVHTNLGNGHTNSRKLENTQFYYMQ